MKYKYIILMLLLSFIPMAVHAENSVKPVNICYITPTRGYVGDKINIKVENYNPTDAKNKILFGTKEAKVIKYTAGVLTVAIPKKAKVCNITIENSAGKSNGVKCFVLPYLEFTLSDKNIEVGQKIKGIIRVRGSVKPWTIKVINKYYEIVTLEGGNELTLNTSGGSENKAEVGIIAKKKGNFNIDFKVLSGYDPKERVARNETKVKPLLTQTTQEQLKEQQLKEQQLKEKADKEKTLKEQQLKEKALKEQQLKEQQLKEKALKEQQLKEQQLKEQQLKEQQSKEQQLKEQQLKEQQLKEQQLKEQQLKEQQLKEQQLKEQQLKEQQLKEQQLKEKAENTNTTFEKMVIKQPKILKEVFYKNRNNI